ncbi:DUF2267 domain-containing protein [Haloplanus sp. C73]|uniref:DUF2267 domain-containing protein n=1 Tax=Haloplanus sp. C73 TaxID=3421641 RepID=UPI003EBD1CC3
MPSSDLLGVVHESDAFDSEDEATRTIDATLRALATNLSQGERRDIAAKLSESYASSVRDVEQNEPTPLDVSSFVERVRTEAAIGQPREKIRVVLAGLTTVIGEDELADARAQLPSEYGRLFEPADLEPGTTFVDAVEAAGEFDHDTAETAARETLVALGHRLTEGEAADIAPYLRGEASGWLARQATHDAERLTAAEFVETVARRTDVPEDRAREYTDAVGDALVEFVPEAERERAEAQLPDQYAAVLNLGE